MKVLLKYIPLLVIILILSVGCSGDQPPASCTRVYVYIEDEDPVLREYDQFFPRHQEYGYYASQYGIIHDSIEYVYQFDNNIFLDRREDYLEVKGAITHDSYLKYCADARDITDTVYVIIDKEGGGYREFLARERFELIRSGDVLKKRTYDGEETLLMDYTLEPGSWSAPGHMRIKLKEKDDIYCNAVYSIRRQVGLRDSVIESFVPGLGFTYFNDGQLELRLKTVEGMPWLGYVEEECQ